jgi:hypothetical protein
MEEPGGAFAELVVAAVVMALDAGLLEHPVHSLELAGRA